MNNWEKKLIIKRCLFIKEFLDCFGWEPNAGDSVGETALILSTDDYSSAYSHRACHIFLRNGWDINVEDIWSNSALVHALDMGFWSLAYGLLQRYEASQRNMINALYTAFQCYNRKKGRKCDHVILTLIEKLDGISPDKCPDALLFAYGGRAVPYIPLLLSAGFKIDPERYEDYFMYNRDSKEFVFEKLLLHCSNLTFCNTKDYPLFIEDKVVRARPKDYLRVWPKLPWRKKKIQHWRPKVRTLNRIAKLSAHGS